MPKSGSAAASRCKNRPARDEDFLPLAMTGISRRVDSIRVRRTQDASIRRVPFQQKIGAGLTLAEFDSHLALACSGGEVDRRPWHQRYVEDSLR